MRRISKWQCSEGGMIGQYFVVLAYFVVVLSFLALPKFILGLADNSCRINDALAIISSSCLSYRGRFVFMCSFNLLHFVYTTNML